jgi:outer membrane lipoprotein-sorting protein
VIRTDALDCVTGFSQQPMRTVASMTPRRRISRRWAAPVIVLVAIAGISIGPNLLEAGAAPPNLPPLTPAELLVKARTAQVTGLSGTAQLTSNLGLPSLDSLAALGGGSDTSVASLLAGTHTAQVWMDGPDKIRVATAAPLAETNWVRNGTDLWSYDSSTQTATHTTMPSNAGAVTDAPDAESSTSSVPDPVHDDPVAFAQSLLDKVTPSTTVTIDSTKLVAGRAAYQLVLSPNSADSTIESVTFAVDAATGLPLDVKVTAKSTGSTALELGFTSIDFTTPAASTFEFSPPPDAKVVQAASPTDLLGTGGRVLEGRRHVDGPETAPPGSTSATSDPSAPPTPDTQTTSPDPGASATHVSTVGTDWTAAVIVSGATIPGQLRPLLNGSDQITVGTTSARMITTTLFTVLVLDDGRVAVGAVNPAALAALVAGAPS